MLLEKFKKHIKAYVRIKISNTKKQNREKIRRIEKFLLYTEKRFGVHKIEQIQQQHIDAFLQHLSGQGKSPETIRKYALATREFAKRAHLKGVYLNPNKAKARKLSRKKEKIITILQQHCNCCSDEDLRKIAADLLAL